MANAGGFSRLTTLYNGTLDANQINDQLTTSIPDLFTAGFLEGFESETKYSSVRESFETNSIAAWNTSKPLFLIHGGSDSTVDPSATSNIYDAMIQSGTSTQVCKKEIIPGLDHGEALIPSMVKGLLFILGIQGGK